MTTETNVVPLQTPDYRICIATGRTDRNNAEVWRTVGVAYDNPGGTITCMGQTVFGDFRFVIVELEYPEGRPNRAPTHGVFTVYNRGAGRPGKWTQQGVAFVNRRNGWNITCDSPIGQVRFSLFPATAKAEQPAGNGEIEITGNGNGKPAPQSDEERAAELLREMEALSKRIQARQPKPSAEPKPKVDPALNDEIPF